MTKTFDSFCNDILKEMLNPNQQQGTTQTTPQSGTQPANTQQQTSTPPTNSTDYKKVWDSVSKLTPQHLTQLMTDLSKHLQTANTSQPQKPQTNATTNKPA